jgi:hypothetical protein
MTYPEIDAERIGFCPERIDTTPNSAMEPAALELMRAPRLIASR